MAWYDEAIFYHIYPLGLAGAPKQNSYGEPEHRLNTLLPWIDHIKSIGCNAIYIGPLFESVGHGYETTDYKKLDSRLGDNSDLKNFVEKCGYIFKLDQCMWEQAAEKLSEWKRSRKYLYW